MMRRLRILTVMSYNNGLEARYHLFKVDNTIKRNGDFPVE